MKKSMILAAAAALALASCAKVETIKNDAPVALGFSVYAGKAAATKAVSGTDFGTITNTELQASTNGFGVFGYYTDAADYASNTKANFMYNQKVTYSGGAWTYSPLKYWPNEHGASAVSTDTDKLTFLAYAPFVANNAIATDKGVSITDKTGSAAADEGIIAMTANNVAKDATLTFKVPASSEEQIDLLYGVLGATYVDVEGATIGTVGSPMENLTKQKTDGKISILFKHALAKIAIDIKEVVDAEDPTTTVSPVSDGTKVVVKSVKLKGTAIGSQGDLNLYTGAWGNLTTATEFTVAPLPAAISVSAAPTAYPSIAGVDEDGLGDTIDLMLIPGPASEITGVEIVYYVCTEDAQLDGGVSVVENKISKDFATALSIEKGKQYGLNLLLGITSIDLTATVEAWDVITPATDVDLPQNVD
ncbi:MAG: fimbrillin family protein [Bacteroidales bacterium]|nr:fimbrillin family protein [Bacteroidales bacterium]